MDTCLEQNFETSEVFVNKVQVYFIDFCYVKKNWEELFTFNLCIVGSEFSLQVVECSVMRKEDAFKTLPGKVMLVGLLSFMLIFSCEEVRSALQLGVNRKNL